MDQRIASFEEFWPYYVSQHMNRTNRRLHYVGTSMAIGCLGALAKTRKLRYLAMALVAGYGPAWIGHFFVEHNRPATFTYPTWSLLADFKMFELMSRGLMDAEVEKVASATAATTGANGHGAVGATAGADPHAN